MATRLTWQFRVLSYNLTDLRVLFRLISVQLNSMFIWTLFNIKTVSLLMTSLKKHTNLLPLYTRIFIWSYWQIFSSFRSGFRLPWSWRGRWSRTWGYWSPQSVSFYTRSSRSSGWRFRTDVKWHRTLPRWCSWCVRQAKWTSHYTTIDSTNVANPLVATVKTAPENLSAQGNESLDSVDENEPMTQSGKVE